MARRYTIDPVQLAKQHTQCTLSWTAADRQEWRGQGGRVGGREEAMMLGRERASVEEGRVEGGCVDVGNGRGRDRARERGEGGSERRRDSVRKGGRKGSKGGILRRALASVQYIHKPFHNAALGLETLVLQNLMKNSEQVYILNFVL